MASFQSAGLAVFGWGYCYLGDPQSEANAAAIQVKNFGLQGYIIDAEGEAAAAGAAAAAQFAAVIKQSIFKPVGLASYRFPTLHMDLAWAQLLSCCTFHCPQVYWLGNVRDVAPAEQLDRSIHELTALAALPVVPIGSAFEWTPQGGPMWRPSIAQLQSFIESARGNRCPGYAWWSWESIASHSDWAAAIATAAVG